MAARRQGARNVELDGDQLEGEVYGLSSRQGVDAFYRASHALLVGISSYGADWRPLPGVVADLEAIRPLLEGLGFTVECKLDLDSNTLSRAIREFLNRPEIGREDRVLLYFAGHGFTRRTQVGEEIGYLLPADAPSSKDEDFLAHALPITHFEHWAREVNAKHVLFVFDACFAGTIFKTFRSSSLALSHRAAQPVRQFITSGGAGEAVPDESFFRQRFVEAPQERNRPDPHAPGLTAGAHDSSRGPECTRGPPRPGVGRVFSELLPTRDGGFVGDLEGSGHRGSGGHP